MKRQTKCWDLDIKLSIPECARVQKSVLAISICNNNCSALFLGAILLQIVILIVSQSHLLSFHCFKSFVKYIRWQNLSLIFFCFQESLGITDDDFDDLEKLFEMFDRDKDGIINRKETQMALRCLGMKTSSEQV